MESQYLAEKFLAANCELLNSFENADVCLLNTCTVTSEADRDVEKLARLIARRNPSARLIITGCYATMHRERIETEIPAAEIVANENKKTVAALILGSCQPDNDWRISGHLGHTRAFVKIQDGCSDGCRYCIVWKARAVKYSKPLPVARAEIAALIKNGCPEIVLTGINVGNYRCPETGADLGGLLSEIFKIEGRFRVRLSSIEPKHITPEFVAACSAGGEKFCEHFHIPLQAGTDNVLAAMGRRYTTAFYAERVALIRAAFETPGIYSDVIAGYPTETESDFESGKGFIKSLALAGLHPFRFSPRPGTPAAELPCHPLPELKRRAEEMRALDINLRENFAASLVGTKQLVTVEETLANGDISGVAGNFQKIIIAGCVEKKSLIEVTVTEALAAQCRAKPYP